MYQSLRKMKKLLALLAFLFFAMSSTVTFSAPDLPAGSQDEVEDVAGIRPVNPVEIQLSAAPGETARQEREIEMERVFEDGSRETFSTLIVFTINNTSALQINSRSNPLSTLFSSNNSMMTTSTTTCSGDLNTTSKYFTSYIKGEHDGSTVSFLSTGSLSHSAYWPWNTNGTYDAAIPPLSSSGSIKSLTVGYFSHSIVSSNSEHHIEWRMNTSGHCQATGTIY